MISGAEELYAIHLKEQPLIPAFEREYRFSKRLWRFDFAWPYYQIATEIEGGIWQGGRHNRAKGFINDCEKYNMATILGWRVLRFPSEWVLKATTAIDMTKQLFETIERERFAELGDV